MDLRLDLDAAERIADRHDSACSSVDECAVGAPAGVDGGTATPYLLDILAGVVGTAAELAALNRAIAQQVRESADAYRAADSSVGDRFAVMAEELR